MLLETAIQTAYEEQEDVETSARELEARIRRIDGAARLMPARLYGKPIDRDAIVKSLTLCGLIAQKDRYLAAYLGISIDTCNAEITCCTLNPTGHGQSNQRDHKNAPCCP
tara:strand:- start:80 stop:409 length:330 start_codon:yes stop_codon:yes gene_type:complete